MKLYKLIFVFLLINTKVLAINDITKLKETVYDFGSQIIQEKGNLSDEFITSYVDFKFFYTTASYNHDFNEQTIQIQYADYLRRVKDHIYYLKRDFNNTYHIKSFESFLYGQDKTSMIDISIIYFDKSKYETVNSEIRTVFSFIIYKGKIKFVGQCKRTDNFAYGIYKLEKIQSARGDEFNKSYKNIFFNYSFYKSIPIKVKSKWGLISLDDKLLLKPTYDSIFPFLSNFAMVISNGKYNLLNQNFKLMFKESYKKIKLENGQYFVSNKKNIFKKYPFELNKPINQPVETEIVTQVIISPSEKVEKVKQETESTYLYNLENEYYNEKKYSIIPNYNPLISDRVHFVLDNKSKDTLSLLKGFEFLDIHKDFIYGFKNDSAFVISPTGKVLFISHYICNYRSPGYVDILDESTNLFGFYSPYTNVYIQPKYKYIKSIDRDKFYIVITKSGEFGYLNRNGKELF